MGDDNERDDRDCGQNDEPCGSPDCGRCQVVCCRCGDEHETEKHDDEVDGPRFGWAITDSRATFDFADVDGVRW